MNTALVAILQSVLSLLYSIQGNPNISIATRQQVLDLADQTIQYALGNSNSTLAPVYPYSNPNISYVTPSSGSVGTAVTIYGSGFGQNNEIYLGNGKIASNVYSNGNSLTVTLDSYKYGPCPVVNGQSLLCMGNPTIYPGTYDLYVVSNGVNSNRISFTITSTSGNSSLYIYNLSPSYGQAGTSITVNGTGFTYSNNVYMRSPQGIRYLIGTFTSNSGTQLTFQVPYTFSDGTPPISGNNYSVEITNSNNITSNAVSFLISGSPFSIQFTSPSGGENWRFGSMQRIAWSSNFSPVNLSLECASGFGSYSCPFPGGSINLANNVYNNYYDWTIGNFYSGGYGYASTGYRLRISSTDNSQSIASNPFYISQ